MKLATFFAHYPIFTTKEFFSYLHRSPAYKHDSAKALLFYHEKSGNIVRIRRGLYAVAPALEYQQKNFQIDPYLIAGRVTEDSILSYHTALDLHGFAYSTFNHFFYLTHKKIRKLEFQGSVFYALPFPKQLITKNEEEFGITTINREGLDIKVTSIERALVDCLSHPAFAGGWEEIWQSFAIVPALNLDIVTKYAKLLNNATTIAKVGFFLEQHREQFAVTENYLRSLAKNVPANPHYIERSNRTPGKYVSRWNLIVPESVLTKKWEEPNEIF